MCGNFPGLRSARTTGGRHAARYDCSRYARLRARRRRKTRPVPERCCWIRCAGRAAPPARSLARQREGGTGCGLGVRRRRLQPNCSQPREMKSAFSRSPGAPRLRWRPAAPAGRCTHPLMDPAARALLALLESLPQRASSLGVADLRITPGSLQSASSAPEWQDARAWRLRCAGHDVWCIADERCQRALLTCILQSAPSSNLTAIERSIFGEAICRFLTASGSADVSEESFSTLQGLGWRCELAIQPHGAQTVTLHFLTAAVTRHDGFAATLDLGKIPLRLRALLPGRSVRLGEVVHWSRGQRIALRHPAEALVATIYVNGRPLGAGKLGSIFGERALKFTAMLPGRDA